MLRQGCLQIGVARASAQYHQIIHSQSYPDVLHISQWLVRLGYGRFVAHSSGPISAHNRGKRAPWGTVFPAGTTNTNSIPYELGDASLFASWQSSRQLLPDVIAHHEPVLLSVRTQSQFNRCVLLGRELAHTQSARRTNRWMFGVLVAGAAIRFVWELLLEGWVSRCHVVVLPRVHHSTVWLAEVVRIQRRAFNRQRCIAEAAE